MSCKWFSLTETVPVRFCIFFLSNSFRATTLFIQYSKFNSVQMLHAGFHKKCQSTLSTKYSVGKDKMTKTRVQLSPFVRINGVDNFEDPSASYH